MYVCIERDPIGILMYVYAYVSNAEPNSLVIAPDSTPYNKYMCTCALIILIHLCMNTYVIVTCLQSSVSVVLQYQVTAHALIMKCTSDMLRILICYN